MAIMRLTGYNENGRIGDHTARRFTTGQRGSSLERPETEDDIAETAFDHLLASPASLAFLETLVTKTEAERAAGQLVDRDPDTL